MTLLRWQEWASVLFGAWLVVSPWELGYSLNGAATANACGVGAVLIVFNLISAWRFLDEGQEIFNILLGAWLLLSPFSLNFSVESGPTIDVMVVGAMVVCLAVWRLYDSTRARKG